MAGVYALARLADDWHEQRQAGIDVLCVYLRLPHNADSNPEERTVRLSIINLITAHLRLDATLSWDGCSFDLSGAWFDGGDFTSLHLTSDHLDFTGATFATGSVHFGGSQIEEARVSFQDAQFIGAAFDNLVMTLGKGSGLQFDGATFASGEISMHLDLEEGSYISYANCDFAGADVQFMGDYAGGQMFFDAASFSAGTVDLTAPASPAHG